MIELKRENLVYKNNALMTGGYKMSLNALKLLSVLISIVDSKEDNEFKEVELGINEITNLLEITNSNFFKEIDRITDELMTTMVYIVDLEGEEITKLQWCSKAKINFEEGIIKLSLHQELEPYLLHLKKDFSKYKIEQILELKSSYSFRMYEILKGYQYKRNFKIKIKTLKTLLMCNSYSKLSHLKDRIIEPSITEINDKTDIKVSYEPIKVGRKVTALEFTVKEKKKPKKSIDSDENTPIQGQINIDEVEAPEKVEISEKELLELNKTYSRQEIEYALKELKSKKDIKNPLSYFEKTLENQRNQNLLKSQKTLNFTNYNQREYDYDLLEKQLLGWDE